MFAANLVQNADNVVLRPPLFAVNVVSILTCLQFEAFMFAVRYTYTDPGVDAYEQKYHERMVNNLKKKAHALGFDERCSTYNQ